MFIQIGSITNVFTGPVKAGRQSPLAALVIGGVVIATSISLTPLVISLGGVLFALAAVLVGLATLVGAVALGIGVPYAARQFRIGAEANRDTMIAHGIQMGIAERDQLRARQQARELPPAPIYVASSTGAVEIEVSR